MSVPRRPSTGLLLGFLLAVLALVGCDAGSTGGVGTGAAVLDPAPAAAGAPATPGAAGVPGGRAAPGTCPAPSPTAPGAAESRLPVTSLCALPPEALPVWRVISTGGRPTYPQDGTVFGNYERRLPQHQRGYYREYTVPTPGARNRGARRLVSGQGRELYYTADHYDSFVVVDPTAVAR